MDIGPGIAMDALLVRIERFVDDCFPGIVECVLVDFDDRKHQFLEKASVLSTANLSFNSAFPQLGYIACLVEQAWMDERGRQLVRVNTTPWGVESTAGESRFTLLRDQIADLGDDKES